jgi:hypothetical protein
VSFSEQNPQTYYLYRLFDFNGPTKSAKSFIYRGPVGAGLELTATVYRARLK